MTENDLLEPDELVDVGTFWNRLSEYSVGDRVNLSVDDDVIQLTFYNNDVRLQFVSVSDIDIVSKGDKVFTTASRLLADLDEGVIEADIDAPYELDLSPFKDAFEKLKEEGE